MYEIGLKLAEMSLIGAHQLHLKKKACMSVTAQQTAGSMQDSLVGLP